MTNFAVISIVLFALINTSRAIGVEADATFGSAGGAFSLLQALTGSLISSEPSSTYDSSAGFGVTKYVTPVAAPAIAINTRGLLAPHIEILRLIEAFLKLKAEALARLNVLVNDNYDLIKAVIKLVSNKVTTLNAFTLKGISVLRKILEFALQLFGQWSITLPTISVGPEPAVYPYEEPVAVPVPVEAYGAPLNGPASFNDYYNGKRR